MYIQKSISNNDLEKLDAEVNNFNKTHKTKATLCYYADGQHIRVLFYEEV